MYEYQLNFNKKPHLVKLFISSSNYRSIYNTIFNFKNLLFKIFIKSTKKILKLLLTC